MIYMTNQVIISDLKRLPTREKQAYGALCLARYCKSKVISHKDIFTLINHLASILVANNLGQWAQQGALLNITGRGDPIPHNLEISLRNGRYDEFVKLVESVVEIGLVDMYGAPTTLPDEFLAESLSILKNNDICAPEVPPVFLENNEETAWGRVFSPDGFKNFIEILECEL